MRFINSPIVLNEDDLFLFAAGGQLEPETNALCAVSGFSLRLFEEIDEDVFVILGNKIFRNSHRLSDDIRLYSVCIDRIAGTLIGALQMYYDPHDNLVDHLLWQSCRVLAQKLKSAPDMKVHIEYPLAENDEHVSKVFTRTLPVNVFVHTRFKED